jgi:hypothetical protein
MKSNLFSIRVMEALGAFLPRHQVAKPESGKFQDSDKRLALKV